jgi:hypothetical protein
VGAIGSAGAAGGRGAGGRRRCSYLAGTAAAVLGACEPAEAVVMTTALEVAFHVGLYVCLVRPLLASWRIRGGVTVFLQGDAREGKLVQGLAR